MGDGYNVPLKSRAGEKIMSDTNDTLEQVREIIPELLGVDADEVVPEARFREELGSDSLDLVELIMAFEDKFGGEISDEEAQGITTVGEAVTYIDTNMR